MVSYTALDGRQMHGEVWSPGPLYNSIWVLREGDRQPVVVHATKRVELEYQQPRVPRPRLDRKALEWALDIRRRHVMMQPHLIAAKPLGTAELVRRPTQREVDAAQAIWNWEKGNHDAHRLFLEHHEAKVPLSDKRFLDIAGES